MGLNILSNHFVFAGKWWSMQLGSLSDVNQTSLKWVGGASHHYCQKLCPLKLPCYALVWTLIPIGWMVGSQWWMVLESHQYLSFLGKKHHPNDYMPKSKLKWWGWYVTANSFPCAFGQDRQCHFVEWNHFLSWAPLCWFVPTKSPCVCCIFLSPCTPSSIGSKCGL